MEIALILFFFPAILGQSPSSCSGSNSTQCGPNSFCNENKHCECVSGYFTPDGSAIHCRSINEPDPACSAFSNECVYCGSSYKGPCLKCTAFITSSGECVNACDDGFQITVFSNSTLSARVCEESSTATTTQIPQWAIIVISVMSGLVILTGLVVLLVFSFTLFNRASSGQFEVEDTDSNLIPLDGRVASPHFPNKGETSANLFNMTFDDMSGDDENAEFFVKLSQLRSHAEVYLSMLNDMRRRLKEIPPDATTAQQYRNVMRDVTRLLYLLNKKSSAIEIPPDGLQLLSWSEQILHRYLASKGHSDEKKSAKIPKTLSAIGDQAETNF